jgi:dTDP-4-dehydrorhamnose reductase
VRILLLGSTGQVGWELQRSLAPLGELVALARNASENPDGMCGDLGDLAALEHTVRTVRPDLIVNAGAYTAVDRAQSEVELAYRINSAGPAMLARQAVALGAWIVHFSTDYVFDGTGSTPWREDDDTGPLSVYGQSKLAGDLEVASNARHLIFRTSWVYAARGGNFAKTMLRLAGEREQLTVIDDQFGAPTSAELLADVCAHAIRSALTGSRDFAGTYHCAASGETSWNGYARYVLEQAAALGWSLRCPSHAVHSVVTANYPTPAPRPLNSRLDTTRLRETFGLLLPHWKSGVRRMLLEISGKNQS